MLVGQLAHFLFSKRGSVHGHLVVHGKRCGSLGVVVRDQVEVKRLVSLVLNDTRVH